MIAERARTLDLDDSWAQVMIGQGIVPCTWSPLADNGPAEDIGPFLQSLAKACRTKAGALPLHRQAIARLAGASAELAS